MKTGIRLLTLFLAILMVFAMTACSKEEATRINVGVLKGPTGMGAVKIAKDSSASAESPDGYSFTFYETADVSKLTSDIINGTLDIAALPVNACATLYNKTNGKVKVIATNALGVLSVIGTEELTSFSDLRGKTIHTTGQASTPEYIINFLLSKNGLNAVTDENAVLGENDVRVIYYPDGTTATSAYTLNGGYAVLPEPATTAALTQNSANKIIFNVTEEWNKVSETKLVQGCLVANSDFLEKYPKAVEKFLQSYKDSVEYINNTENADDSAQLMVEFGIVPKAPIAKNAISRANIVCITGSEMKSDVKGMLNVLFDSDASSVGGKEPDDNFYALYEIS